jgi:hypothetical protein
MLYDASQGTRDHNRRSSSKPLKDKGDTPAIEPEPTPTAGTLCVMGEMGGHRDGEVETALERTTDKSLHKNMFRAFDGTALITIGGYFNLSYAVNALDFRQACCYKRI